MTPEQIVTEYPHLSVVDIHAAVAFAAENLQRSAIHAIAEREGREL